MVAVVVYRRRLHIINLQSPFLRCAAATVTTSCIGTRWVALQRGAQRHTAGTGAATGCDGARRRSNI